MDQNSIELVQTSFKKVAPIADVAADIFYARLFEVAPEFRPLFKRDIKTQGQMLMSALAMAVNGLSKPESIAPAIQQLGVRHKGYGVKPADYATVGETLLFTLEKGLGADFTPAVKTAWSGAIALLAGLMIEAAESA